MSHLRAHESEGNLQHIEIIGYAACSPTFSFDKFLPRNKYLLVIYQVHQLTKPNSMEGAEKESVSWDRAYFSNLDLFYEVLDKQVIAY